MRAALAILVALSLLALASYEPYRYTVPDALIPGDTVKIATAPGALVKVSCVDRGVQRELLERVSNGSLLLEIPWCRDVAVEIYEGESKRVISIPVSPEVKVIVAGAPWDVEREGAIRKIMILVRTNVEGEAIISIRDETRGVLLAKRAVELADRGAYDFYIKIPDNPSFLWYKKLSELRRIRVEIAPPQDTYGENNYDDFYLSVTSPDYWRIPWGATLLLGGVALLALLAALSRRIFD